MRTNVIYVSSSRAPSIYPQPADPYQNDAKTSGKDTQTVAGGEGTVAQEEVPESPANKIRRLEDSDKAMGGSSISYSRRLLHGFLWKLGGRTSSPTSELPKPILVPKMTKIKSHAQDKENLEPSATVFLKDFRKQQQECPPPPPGIRRHPRAHLLHSLITPVTESQTREDPQGKLRRGVVRRSPRDVAWSSGTVYVTHKQMMSFFQLVEEPVVLQFLSADVCCRYADKYLLAMAFTYLVRAGLSTHLYSTHAFFAALYLAHDMEEDEEELKYEVLPWALGRGWRASYPLLLRRRDDIFWAIDCRAVVSEKGCRQVMAMEPDHWLWQRERLEHHGGALRDYLKHPSDDGHPRGPDKSPLQCYQCLKNQCTACNTSSLIYQSQNTSSESDQVQDPTSKTWDHHLQKDLEDDMDLECKEPDSGFETFLCEYSDTSNLSNISATTIKPTATTSCH